MKNKVRKKLAFDFDEDYIDKQCVLVVGYAFVDIRPSNDNHIVFIFVFQVNVDRIFDVRHLGRTLDPNRWWWRWQCMQWESLLVGVFNFL
jgi:hypothetical protein